MDFLTNMKISSSGLAVQRKRMETISSNLANMETTRTPEGGPYRRKDVLITALPLENEFGNTFKNELGDKLSRVQVADVIEDQSEPRLVYNPNHPDANDLGYVALPNIDQMNRVFGRVIPAHSFIFNSMVTAGILGGAFWIFLTYFITLQTFSLFYLSQDFYFPHHFTF